MKKIISTAFLFLSIFIFSTQSAFSTSPIFSFIKNLETNLNYTTTPGSKIKDFIIIKNMDPERWIEVAIKPINFPKRWLQEENQKIRIEPNSQIQKDINIIIPKNAEIGQIEGTLSIALINYKKEDQVQSGNFTVGLGIGNLIKINIVPGEIKSDNYSNTPETPETPVKTTVKQELNIKELTSKAYIIIEDNINIILLLIIISLLLKLALQTKSQERTITSEKNNTIKESKQKKKPTKVKNTKPKTIKKTLKPKKPTNLKRAKKK